jgi:hypothetical protein
MPRRILIDEQVAQYHAFGHECFSCSPRGKKEKQKRRRMHGTPNQTASGLFFLAGGIPPLASGSGAD